MGEKARGGKGKDIYGKLDVHSRAQAVARAGQLTILGGRKRFILLPHVTLC
jgi:hypothetical protein